MTIHPLPGLTCMCRHGYAVFTSATAGSTPNWAHPCFHTGIFIWIVVSSFRWPINTCCPAGSTSFSPPGLCCMLHLDLTECRKEVKQAKPQSPPYPNHCAAAGLPPEPTKKPLISDRYRRSNRGNTSFLGKSLIRLVRTWYYILPRAARSTYRIRSSSWILSWNLLCQFTDTCIVFFPQTFVVCACACWFRGFPVTPRESKCFTSRMPGLALPNHDAA